MTPAARVQTSIELLDAIIEAAKAKGAPADRILAEWFRNNRFAGSKDRRAIRELVYDVIRLCGPVPNSGREAMIAYGCFRPENEHILQMFDGSRYGPAEIETGSNLAEYGVAPKWLEQRLSGSDLTGEDATALLDRAPLDLRINTLMAERATLSLPADAEPTAAPHGLRLSSGTQVEQWPEYRDGTIEVQDTGSQLACLAVDAQPGETIVDLCAGGGGKTLALAAAMDNLGRIVASDTDRGRLSRLVPRAERAGATIIETRLLDPKRERDALTDLEGSADAVLVDAPCSGTGTWRRNPEARWRLDEGELGRLRDLQGYLLDLAATLVKPGGRLIYVTCSLLDEEGARQFDDFLSRAGDFKPHEITLPAGRKRGTGIRLTPYHDGTDGFFIARADRS